MNKEQLSKILSSFKGISGTGNILPDIVSKLDDFVGTMEPGDFVRGDTNTVTAAPVSHDLWYLFYSDNLMKKHFAEGPDFNHKDYSSFISSAFSFLTAIGIRPLKVLTDLAQLDIKAGFGDIIPSEYQGNGIYWVNTAAFELWTKAHGAQYPSDGPKNINDYVGYLAFPIGQLGTMEVISLLQETDLAGCPLAAVYSDGNYWPKDAPAGFTEEQKPSIQSPPIMFPEMKDAGKNYCYGRHLIESGYVRPETPVPSQNSANSEGSSAYAPVAKSDVEIFASPLTKYGDVKPKKWMRYWIHKDSTLPVPGEFMGILCRPVVAPPHVWWFQESSPFLYAGNWLETNHLTSGVVTAVIEEDARTDGGIGSLYTVKVQGCEVQLEATDFCEYSVGDRVAVLKMDSTAAEQTKSFTWEDQTYLKDTDAGTKKTNLIIIPATFYKIKT